MVDINLDAVIVSVDGFFEALENNLMLHSNWIVGESVADDVRLWLEENENRDWTFLMPEESVDGVYTVRILER